MTFWQESLQGRACGVLGDPAGKDGGRREETPGGRAGRTAGPDGAVGRGRALRRPKVLWDPRGRRPAAVTSPGPHLASEPKDSQ